MSKLLNELIGKHATASVVSPYGNCVSFTQENFLAALDEAMEMQRKACADGARKMIMDMVRHGINRWRTSDGYIKRAPIEHVLHTYILNAKVEDNA